MLWKKVFHSMEKSTPLFPCHGKNPGKFSMLWKTFGSGPRLALVPAGLVRLLPDNPCAKRALSTLWKNPAFRE
jgi:hypothetical protein